MYLSRLYFFNFDYYNIKQIQLLRVNLLYKTIDLYFY